MRDKSNKKFWDKIAKLYAAFMKKDKEVYDKVCEYICPYLRKDMNVLELACGSGQLTFKLAKYAKTWVGTDFSEQMISEARKCGEYENLTFETADATSLSFSDGEFDCVLIANALHIMPKPDKAMKEIYRVLKPQGILFAPTFLWKEGKRNKFIKMLMSFIGFKMYKEWDKKQFEDFIEEYGFSVLEMNSVQGGLVPVGVMIAKRENKE